MIYPRIVTVGYGDPEGIRALLDSLVQHLKAPAEIVVHDNGGARAAVESWREQKSLPFSIAVIGEGKNIGFSAAVNRATEFNSGHEWTHLLCLNPDLQLLTDITPTTLDVLAAKSGIIGFRVFDDAARSSRQASARRFPSVLTSFTGREGWLTRLWPTNPWSRRYLATDLVADQESLVDWVSGCALWVAKSDWQKLRGFDESYFLYVEDVDLGRKAQQHKLPVRYLPVVDVVHHTRGTSKKSPWRADLYHHLGMWTYHVKWAGPLGFILGPFVFVGIWLRFLVRRLTH
ncbi:MAG: glycosyltransferase family 2 protein [Bdellovibrionales bacterium]|nr:glycosyltransferase family 2 protein [Bdellovibrionales bacterium]